MSQHATISPVEAADRLAIRELIEAYAHCADRRDAKGQMALFTADTHFVVYMNAKDPKPSQELNSREELAQPGARELALLVEQVSLGDQQQRIAVAQGQESLLNAV